jgi:starvation-inducible DNA-binding protein
MGLNIGLNQDSDSLTIDLGLRSFLADIYLLYIQTLNFHWDMKPSDRLLLQPILETQYLELIQSADRLTDRIRQLGLRAPVSYSEFVNLSSIRESENLELLNTREVIFHIIDSHESAEFRGKRALSQVYSLGDRETAQLLLQCIQVHERAASNLRQFLV